MWKSSVITFLVTYAVGSCVRLKWLLCTYSPYFFLFMFLILGFHHKWYLFFLLLNLSPSLQVNLCFLILCFFPSLPPPPPLFPPLPLLLLLLLPFSLSILLLHLSRCTHIHTQLLYNIGTIGIAVFSSRNIYDLE